MESIKHTFTEDERNYINLLDNAIVRMSGNSANAKSFLITIVVALLAIQMPNKENANLMFITLLPITLFYWLDCYYLSLEKKFRNLQKAFVKNCYGAVCNVPTPLYAYNINDVKGMAPKLKSILSWSTTPFYMAITICIVVLWAIIKYM